MKIVLSFAMPLLLAATSSQAATLYVAPAGIDSSTCGASASPCKSIRRAIRTSSGMLRVAPGDQILLKGGVYVSEVDQYNRFYIENFVPDRNACSTPTPQNSLRIGVDPQASTDVLIEMGASFADPAKNTARRGSLMQVLQSNCIIIDGDNGNGKRLILDGKERQFGLANPFYVAYDGGPIPSPSDPQPTSTGLLTLVDYSGASASLPTDALVYGGVAIRNLEVRNTMGSGITMNKYRDVAISNNHVHHTFFRAIGGYGYNVLLEGNQVEYGAQINRNNVMFYARQDHGGWPGVMQMGGDYEFRDLHSRSGNVIMRNNRIVNSWGEGIINGSDGGEIVGNTVANTYSVGIYLERSTGMRVEQNHVYANDALFHRPLAATPWVAASSTPDAARRALDGITLATESGSGGSSALVFDLTIINNVIAGARRAFTYWYDASNTNPSNSYANINFSHNTLIGSTGDVPIRIYALGAGVERHADNRIMNNLIEVSTGNGTWQLGDPGLWSLEGNYVFARGAYAAQALQGPDFAPGAAPGNYALTQTSPARATQTAPIKQCNVWQDWLGYDRAETGASVGAFEFGAGSETGEIPLP